MVQVTGIVCSLCACSTLISRYPLFIFTLIVFSLSLSVWQVHKADREIVLEAGKLNEYALKHAAPDLIADRGIVLEALKHNGYVPDYAAPELKVDRELKLEAVKQNGSALARSLKQNGHSPRQVGP